MVSRFIGRGELVEGGSGAESLFGGGGNDTIFAGSGADTVDGGGGTDYVLGNQDDDFIFGGEGNDTLHGGRGSDYLLGNQGDDLLQGGRGDDFLHGGQGGDVIEGGDGSDSVCGGKGDDTVTGGDGADVFIASEGDDTILDFKPGQDRVDLSALGIGDFAERSVSGGTIIDLGGKTLFIEGVPPALFTAHDFITNPNAPRPPGVTAHPPVNTVPAAYAANQDVNKVLTGISVTDSDSNTLNSVTLTATHGTLTLSTAVAGGVTAGQVSGNNSASVTVTAPPLAALNATLADAAGLTFVPQAGYSGAATFTISSFDGTYTDTDSSAITLIPSNVAPAIAGANASVTILENAANSTAQLIDPTGMTLSDADNPANLNNGVLTVSYVSGGGAEDQLTIIDEGAGSGQIGVSGANVSYGGTLIGTIAGGANGASMTVTLNASATLAAADRLLDRIGIANSSNAPTAARTLGVTITDGQGGTATTQNVIVNVTPEAEPSPASTLALSSLNGTTGFRLDGVAASDYSGYSVSNAGDVNGDGFDDLIVGAWQADPNGSSSGSSYIVFGKASGWSSTITMNTTNLNGTTGFRLDGLAASNYSGISISNAGDVNADGFDDLIVGASGADPNAVSDSGSSYVVFGKASGWSSTITVNTTNLNGTTGFRLDGVAASDFSGDPVSNAGDVNGDGFGDIIVGTALADPNGSGSGSSYIVFGKASGWASTITMNTTNLDGTTGFRLDGLAASDFSGISVSNAGDVNGDGFDDLIVGAWQADPNGSNSGSSYIVFGKASGWSSTMTMNTTNLNGTTGFRLDGLAASDYSGFSVSNAGDFNGDGFIDLIVGAKYANPNGSDSGSSYIIFGKASGWSSTLTMNTTNLNGTTGFRLDGVATNDYSGFSVSNAGDFNGDGFDDLIVGAKNADPNAVSNSGSTYIIYGKASGWSSTMTMNTTNLNGTTGFRLDGVTANDNSGVSVSTAGDVNGDGFEDLIVGAYFANPNGADSGSSYVVFGNNSSGAVTHLGGSSADTLTGDANANVMNGGLGNDTLSGGGGNDIIKGANGDDSITGGAGVDKLWGGHGADIFVYSAAGDSGTGSGNRDIIYDFHSIASTTITAERDIIDLSAFTGSFTWLGTGAFTGTANEARYVNTGKNSIVYIDTDANGAANFEIQLPDVKTLASGDFLL